MKYICQICGWVYDEEQGAPEQALHRARNLKTCPKTSLASSVASAKKILPKKNKEKSARGDESFPRADT